MADDPVIGEWSIGDFTPQHIIDWDFSSYPTIKLHCLAKQWQAADARWEIHQIMEMACSKSITEKPTLNGGTCQRIPAGCQKLTITDGFYEWDGIVKFPGWKEGPEAKPGPKQVIEWDIILEVIEKTRTLVQTEPEEP